MFCAEIKEISKPNVLVFKPLKVLREESPEMFHPVQRWAGRVVQPSAHPSFPVLVVETDEQNDRGEMFWAVMPDDDHEPDYWIEMFDSQEDALSFCEERHYRVLDVISRDEDLRQRLQS